MRHGQTDLNSRHHLDYYENRDFVKEKSEISAKLRSMQKRKDAAKAVSSEDSERNFYKPSVVRYTCGTRERLRQIQAEYEAKKEREFWLGLKLATRVKMHLIWCVAYVKRFNKI